MFLNFLGQIGTNFIPIHFEREFLIFKASILIKPLRAYINCNKSYPIIQGICCWLCVNRREWVRSRQCSKWQKENLSGNFATIFQLWGWHRWNFLCHSKAQINKLFACKGLPWTFFLADALDRYVPVTFALLHDWVLLFWNVCRFMFYSRSFHELVAPLVQPNFMVNPVTVCFVDAASSSMRLTAA